MELLQPFLTIGVMGLAVTAMFRTLFGGRRRFRSIGSSLRGASAAWDAAGKGVVLGGAMSVLIQATLGTATHPFNWLGLAVGVGLLTFVVWMVPSMGGGIASATVGTIVVELAIGVIAAGAAVRDVVTSSIPTGDKFQFLVPIGALVMIGLPIAGIVNPRLPGGGSRLESVANLIAVGLLAVEVAVGMHLPLATSVAAVGPASRLLVFAVCCVALVVIVLVPAAVTPIGVAVALIALLGDWSNVTMAAGMPIPATTVTAATMAIEVLAVYAGHSIRPFGR